MQRSVAAAADVVDPAPVGELVAGRRGDQDVARGLAGQRRPDPGQRVGVVAAAQDAVADARAQHLVRPLQRPPRAALVAHVAARREAQLDRPPSVARRRSHPPAGPGATSRGRRPRCPGRCPRSAGRSPSGPRPAARRPSPSAGPGTARSRRRRGRTRWGTAGASPRRPRPATPAARPGACEWSATTTTACSSRNVSAPPPACIMRSSWRSAVAIDATCACGPFGVRVRVVVGQREQQEVEEVMLHQVRADAAGVLVADAGQAELRATAGVPAGEEVGVEELPRAHDRPADDGRGQPRQRRLARDLVAVAAPVEEVRRAGRAHVAVVERLEHRGHVLRQVLEVHVVDRVRQLLDDTEAPRRAEARSVLDVALLIAAVPVHGRDPVTVLARAGGDRGRTDRSDRGEGRAAGIDVGPALHDGLQRRRAAGLDRPLEHGRLEPVDDGQHELGRAGHGYRRMRSPAYFSPSRRRPPASRRPKKPMASSASGGRATDSPAMRTATPAW